MDTDATVDARGLICPQPLVHTKRRLEAMAAGEVVKVLATDPHAELDFEVFCLRSGHQLIDRNRVAGEWTFWIRKRGADRAE